MISDTSLVTNMDVKNTPNTRNRDRVVIRFIREARRTTGSSTFSRLKPSRTHSIISRVPRVRQSMSRISCGVGGVTTRAIAAASTDRVSISSFFRN